ncbi:MAG: hypothetical protein JXB47_15220 [Anaerolineae bacterium]|nr:hypothetical protein [Anaerolineae bacterium]
MLHRLMMFTLLVVLLTGAAAAAQDDGGWVLADVQDLKETIGDYDFEGAVLAPDGSAFAWPDRGVEALCVYTFADALLTCSPWPEWAKIPAIHYLAWSPDGHYLAFTQEFFRYLNEPDIWVYEVTTGAFTNYTDDGVDKIHFDESPSYWIDTLPVWDPNTGDLYFFSTDNRRTIFDLYRLDLDDGVPELVFELTGLLEPFLVWQPPAISPGDDQMALLVMAPDLADPRNGVWELDLEDGAFNQVAGLQPLADAGAPVWLENYLPTLESVVWVAHNAVLVSAADYRMVGEFPGQNSYYIDLGDNSVTAVVDFGDVPDRDSFFTPGSDGHSAQYRIPRLGIVAPDNSAFFYLHYEAGAEDAAISALSLPPDGGAPARLGPIDEYKPLGRPQMLVRAGANGYALLFYRYLLVFERQ